MGGERDGGAGVGKVMLCACMHVFTYLSMYVCMHVCMCACMHAVTYLSMCVCIHACMHAYMKRGAGV